MVQANVLRVDNVFSEMNDVSEIVSLGAVKHAFSQTGMPGVGNKETGPGSAQHGTQGLKWTATELNTVFHQSAVAPSKCTAAVETPYSSSLLFTPQWPSPLLEICQSSQRPGSGELSSQKKHPLN